MTGSSRRHRSGTGDLGQSRPGLRQLRAGPGPVRRGQRRRRTRGPAGRGGRRRRRRGAADRRASGASGRSPGRSTPSASRLPGLHLRCVNCIPHGGGLGSSAAAIVAGSAARPGAARPAGGERAAVRPTRTAGAWRTEMEGHPDNVAPALFGGFTAGRSPTRRGRPVAVRRDGASRRPGGRVQRATSQLDRNTPAVCCRRRCRTRRRGERGGRRPAGARADQRPVATCCRPPATGCTSTIGPRPCPSPPGWWPSCGRPGSPRWSPERARR